MEFGKEKDVMLVVEHLCKYFPITKGLMRRQVGTVRAVDDVSFFVKAGEVFGLVGESGCGKTTCGRSILRAIEPTSGKATFDMMEKNRDLIDLFDLDRAELKDMRRYMRMIFQDPYSSLNPRMNVRQIISEPLRIHKIATGRSELDDRVTEVLKAVGLDGEYMTRFPHAFSGGQRQRISIARALVMQPKFIVADECVSALDVSVQAQILNLMQDLQEQFDLTYLFIAHNLAVVEHFCDRIGVMYVGKMAELADTTELYGKPRHPYTEALLAAVPRSEPGHTAKRELLSGEVADPGNPPSGCYFHPRCKYCKDICKGKRPEFRDISKNGEAPHYVACHFADELDLKGVS